MRCAKEKICSVRAIHLDNEIDTSFKNIQSQRSNSVAGVKIYLTILFSLFGYFGFLNTKISNSGGGTNEQHVFFGVFGVAIILVSFICGWILLDYITNTIFSTILQYKHISYMRSLKSKKFDNHFSDNCIYPLATKKVPLKRSRHLPIVFCITNFLLLLVIYYSLSIAFSWEICLTYTLFVLGLFAVYFPNVCIKYYEETSIAQFIHPYRDEERVRDLLAEKVKKETGKKYYRFLHWILIVSMIIFVFSLGINAYAIHIDKISIPRGIYISQIVGLLLIGIFRYLMVEFRLRKGCL